MTLKEKKTHFKCRVYTSITCRHIAFLYNLSSFSVKIIHIISDFYKFENIS